jgi:hypothetical protein
MQELINQTNTNKVNISKSIKSKFQSTTDLICCIFKNCIYNVLNLSFFLNHRILLDMFVEVCREKTLVK